jgi:hypothetical protein
MLESAHEIDPDDESEEASRIRELKSLKIFDGLEFWARVDIKAGRDGYADRNVIDHIVTPDMADWQGSPPAPKPPLHKALDDEIPF